MTTSTAITYHAHGAPSEVLRLEERTLPALAPEEVELQLRAATINPSDFGMILGNYGRLRELPAVGGREGLFEVVSAGIAVVDFNVGDRVLVKGDEGSWQSRMVCHVSGLRKIPDDIPDEFAAMAGVNPPTSWRLLRDANLPSGSWLVQNGANSAVGFFVIQMAKKLGLKTLNVVRREELIQPLTEMGADVVVTEESGYEKKIEALTNGGNVLLALNSIGGESAIRLVKALSPGGTHVTFGAMTFEQVRFPTRFLIFDDITLSGFWMDKWYRDNSAERVQIMFDNLFNLVREGIVTAPVSAKYPLSKFKEAIEAASQPKLGKVLLVAE